MTKERNPEPPDPSKRPDPPPSPPASVSAPKALTSAVDLREIINGLQEACERYRQVIERLEAGRVDAGLRIEALQGEGAKLRAARRLLLLRPEVTDRQLLDRLAAALE